ncbi:MAG: hypothetical protein JJU46_12455 [Balneolaceae bacterium]|nr:hypothetical protein [Balneolaceae bacterium]MCH8547389.1 hypothetical protein [Balneolaceae bacterium]
MLERIKGIEKEPKNLFLIDGIGAFLTAFLLLAILRPFHELFGMPPLAVMYLSAIAAIFCLYSITCFLFLKGEWKLYLKIISTANLLYCCLTLGLLIYYFQLLTALGITYFLVEILAISLLVRVEQKAIYG